VVGRGPLSKDPTAAGVSEVAVSKRTGTILAPRDTHSQADRQHDLSASGRLLSRHVHQHSDAGLHTHMGTQPVGDSKSQAGSDRSAPARSVLRLVPPNQSMPITAVTWDHGHDIR